MVLLVSGPDPGAARERERDGPSDDEQRADDHEERGPGSGEVRVLVDYGDDEHVEEEHDPEDPEEQRHETAERRVRVAHSVGSGSAAWTLARIIPSVMTVSSPPGSGLSEASAEA